MHAHAFLVVQAISVYVCRRIDCPWCFDHALIICSSWLMNNQLLTEAATDDAQHQSFLSDTRTNQTRSALVVGSPDLRVFDTSARPKP